MAGQDLNLVLLAPPVTACSLHPAAASPPRIAPGLFLWTLNRMLTVRVPLSLNCRMSSVSSGVLGKQGKEIVYIHVLLRAVRPGPSPTVGIIPTVF